MPFEANSSTSRLACGNLSLALTAGFQRAFLIGTGLVLAARAHRVHSHQHPRRRETTVHT